MGAFENMDRFTGMMQQRDAASMANSFGQINQSISNVPRNAMAFQQMGIQKMETQSKLHTEQLRRKDMTLRMNMLSQKMALEEQNLNFEMKQHAFEQQRKAFNDDRDFDLRVFNAHKNIESRRNEKGEWVQTVYGGRTVRAADSDAREAEYQRGLKENKQKDEAHSLRMGEAKQGAEAHSLKMRETRMKPISEIDKMINSLMDSAARFTARDPGEKVEGGEKKDLVAMMVAAQGGGKGGSWANAGEAAKALKDRVEALRKDRARMIKDLPADLRKLYEDQVESPAKGVDGPPEHDDSYPIPQERRGDSVPQPTIDAEIDYKTQDMRKRKPPKRDLPVIKRPSFFTGTRPFFAPPSTVAPPGGLTLPNDINMSRGR